MQKFRRALSNVDFCIFLVIPNILDFPLTEFLKFIKQNLNDIIVFNAEGKRKVEEALKEAEIEPFKSEEAKP